ncbi:MAG: hypothetical protein R3362_08605 [Rhodothermales bacterium]|nr:hypothetical protein [Rhodothermales bacterium]
MADNPNTSNPKSDAPKATPDAAPSAGKTSASGTPAPNVGTSKEEKGGPSGAANAGPARPVNPAGSSAMAGATAGAAAGSAGGTTPGATGPRPVTSHSGAGNARVDTLSYEPQDDWVDKARTWVEDNPALAVLGAVALGLVAGRLIAAAIPEPEPESLADKIEARAKALAKEGRYYADDAGDAIAKQLAVAAAALGEASHVVSKNAKKGYAEAKDVSESIAEAVGHALSKKTSEWLDKLS